jgi:hypothetical protein
MAGPERASHLSDSLTSGDWVTTGIPAVVAPQCRHSNRQISGVR